MRQMRKIELLVLIIGAFLIFFSTYASENVLNLQKKTAKSNLSTVLQSKVIETIKYSDEIPGLKSDEFSGLRTQILKTWNILTEDGVLEVSGTDKDVRPYFVALQAVVEHVLASELKKEVKVLKGVIHTPMPATPLCTAGDISKELIDPSIEVDPARLFTVKARTTIVRDYLFKGGNLYIIYPKDGFKKRTEQQQKVYLDELTNYPAHLFDVPLDCENIPADLIGATYLFQDCYGKTFVFAIKMTQAKDPKEIGNFGLWFGPITHPAIQKRVKSIANYLKQYDSNVFEWKEYHN